MRRVRAVVAALVAVLAVLLPAAPAWAHAALLESTPADGQVLVSQPAEIVLRFSERVATGLGSVKVVGPDGKRADTGQVGSRSGGKQVVAELRDGLPQGTYVLLWRVVSEDSHPVSGASTFSVGRQTETAHAHAEPDAGGAGRLLPVSRWVLYAGLVLLVGGGAFVLVLWPAGAASPPARRVLWAGWSLAVVGTGAGLLLQGPYAAGLPLSRALDGALLREVLASKYGTAAAVRLGLLAFAVPVLATLAPFRRTRAAVLAGPLAAGLLVTTSIAGHAGAGSMRAVAVPADALHLAAACAWAGGLALLVLVVLRQPSDALRGVLTRWSPYAAGAVAILVLTGLFAGWREVREPEALLPTDYGRLLLAKTAAVIVMLALGAAGRSWVRRRYMTVVHASADLATAKQAPPAEQSVARLRRSVLAEAALAVAVLGLTAWLVGTAPARSAYAPVFTQTKEVTSGLRVQVDVEPARAGLNDMHVYYTAAGGKAVDVEQVAVRWTRSGTDDTVPADIPRDSLGHYERLRVPLPSAGTWQLAVTTRTSDIDAYTTRFTVQVR